MDTQEMPDFSMEADSLYREEVYSDRKLGSIHVLHPVDAKGEADSGRDTIYMGNTQIMTPYGAMPLSFEIEADGLATAIEKFGEAAKQALEETIEQAKQAQREAASSIVIPDAQTTSKIQLK